MTVRKRYVDTTCGKLNAIMERWVRSCRTELLDRTLIVNQANLCTRFASTRPSTTNTGTTARSTPRHPYARSPIRSPHGTDSTASTSDDATDLAASSTSTNTPPELHGWVFGPLTGGAPPAC
jgi:hypothetical protein